MNDPETRRHDIDARVQEGKSRGMEGRKEQIPALAFDFSFANAWASPGGSGSGRKFRVLAGSNFLSVTRSFLGKRWLFFVE